MRLVFDAMGIHNISAKVHGSTNPYNIAESGRLIRQSLTLMVLPATGVIKPGRLLRYTDAAGQTRLGLVRATTLNWAFPALTQTITVQSHA